MQSNEVNNIHLILNAESVQIIVYSISQHSSAWWSDQSFWTGNVTIRYIY